MSKSVPPVAQSAPQQPTNGKEFHMSRITVIDHHNANAEQKALLDAIQAQIAGRPRSGGG